MSQVAESQHEESSARSNAPFHVAHQAAIVSIEHPGIIKNFDNGIKSLGGEAHMRHVLDHNVGDSTIKVNGKANAMPEPVAGVSLRPSDPLAKRISSIGVLTRNVLVRVSLPKRTGRKRKRGSDDPFAFPESSESTTFLMAPQLLERLRESQSSYSMEALGSINQTHRFRNPPDFQMMASDLPIMQDIKSHILIPDYDKLKDFHLDMTAGPQTISEYPVAPEIAPSGLTNRYDYQQVDDMVLEKDEQGNDIIIHTKGMLKRRPEQIPIDAKTVPDRPPPGVESLLRCSLHLAQEAAANLQKLLDVRPIVTKRVAMNSIPGLTTDLFKEATALVGYIFKGGPWRDTLIRYGVDPRSDPKYRRYQIIGLQMDRDFGGASKEMKFSSSATQTRQQTNDSHIFDGKNAHTDGRLWQICDMTDPNLLEVFDTTDIRAECDVQQWGWYWSGTIAKGRTLMRDKLLCLLTRQPQPYVDYEVVAGLPDRMADYFDVDPQFLAPACGKNAARLVAEARALARVGFGRMQPTTKPRGGRGTVADDEEGGDGDDGEVGDATGNVELGEERDDGENGEE